MTRARFEVIVRQAVEEAYKADAPYMEEAFIAVTGGEVFCWHLLRMRQLHALYRSALIVRML